MPITGQGSGAGGKTATVDATRLKAMTKELNRVQTTKGNHQAEADASSVLDGADVTDKLAGCPSRLSRKTSCNWNLVAHTARYHWRASLTFFVVFHPKGESFPRPVRINTQVTWSSWTEAQRARRQTMPSFSI
jgi:hypothetical protein